MKDKLREMYENGLRGIEPSISANGLLKAVANGWITTEDAVEILGSDNALETVRAAKLLEISKACNAAIIAGVDVPIGDRRDHFNLKLEDQSNINNLFRVVELGGTEYPYQADDGTCTVYSATEIAAVQYGMDLPEPYAAALSEKMAVAQAQMEAIMQKLGGVA